MYCKASAFPSSPAETVRHRPVFNNSSTAKKRDDQFQPTFAPAEHGSHGRRAAYFLQIIDNTIHTFIDTVYFSFNSHRLCCRFLIRYGLANRLKSTKKSFFFKGPENFGSYAKGVLFRLSIRLLSSHNLAITEEASSCAYTQEVVVPILLPDRPLLPPLPSP